MPSVGQAEKVPKNAGFSPIGLGQAQCKRKKVPKNAGFSPIGLGQAEKSAQKRGF